MFKNILLIVLLASFLLPFVPPGCSDMRSNEPVEAPKDNNSEVDTLSSNQDSTFSNSDEKIGKKDFTILERIFKYPDNENLSALGYLLDYFIVEYFLMFFGVLITFLVFIQRMLSVKFFTFPDFWLLLIGFILLAILSILHYDDVIWGFWVSLGIYLIVVVIFFKLKYFTKIFR